MYAAYGKKSRKAQGIQNTSLQNGEWVTILDSLGKLPWYRSIRWKLAFSYIALSIVFLIVFNFIVMNSIQAYHMESRINQVKTQAIIFADYIGGVHSFRALDIAPSIIHQHTSTRSAATDTRILVINDYARVLADSNQSRLGETLILQEVLQALGGSDSAVLVPEEEALNVAVSIRDTSSDRVGAVLMIASVTDIFESMEDIRTTLTLATLLVSLLVIVLIFIISNLLIAPLQRTVTVVRRITTGQLSTRIPVKGKDEYAILAMAFNDMTDRLDQVEKTREEFVSNVSHEMKTPLSAIKVLSESILLQETAPEAMYREFLQDINSEVDRMTNITNDLLALVRVEQRDQGLNIKPLNLTHLVEDILGRLAPLAEQKKIALMYEAARAVQINADEIKLTIAISNIVENGIKYTPKSGTVRVIVDADLQNASITIQDTGPGIPLEEQDKVFNRFYRVDKTRDRETGGTGLGLAISRATIVLHGGTIRLKSVENEGAQFTIRLPL